MNIGTRNYEGFGGPADISVDALTSIEEESEFWEKKCKKLEKAARSERIEHLEDIQHIRDFMPGVTTWKQLIAGIEAMQMRIEQLEEGTLSDIPRKIQISNYHYK